MESGVCGGGVCGGAGSVRWGFLRNVGRVVEYEVWVVWCHWESGCTISLETLLQMVAALGLEARIGILRVYVEVYSHLWNSPSQRNIILMSRSRE